uniref:Eukaryotic translation initiation factor 3 subunit G n=1 Tax=Eurycantha calcarata TaxID=93610 RepID=A0A481SZH0_9NEOP|nr:eukaryotic translation initiation factor 3 subunit G [Eurycantha calcarata]
MPAADEIGTSWADEVEEEGTAGLLPPSTEVINNGCKIITEYKFNDEGKKIKVVRTFKIERVVVSKTIALRKTWPKFGQSKNDKPGPNPATTVVAEDVFMQFISSKEEENKQEEDVMDKLKSVGDKLVKCRKCNGDHWTTKCPFRDTELPSGKMLDDKKPSGSTTVGGVGGTVGDDKTKQAKYVPPSLRGDGSKRDGMTNLRLRDDTTAIRVSNLSDSTTETDLEDLVKPFGPISKLYLSRDKQTGICKGFAYIHFKMRSDAAEAIAALHGHGYDHLILNVDWSKPPAASN